MSRQFDDRHLQVDAVVPVTTGRGSTDEAPRHKAVVS